jgi:hypothetical protein
MIPQDSCFDDYFRVQNINLYPRFVFSIQLSREIIFCLREFIADSKL